MAERAELYGRGIGNYVRYKVSIYISQRISFYTIDSFTLYRYKTKILMISFPCIGNFNITIFIMHAGSFSNSVASGNVGFKA